MKKLTKIIPVAACAALVLASCDDDKMNWHSPIPEGGTAISADEIPLSSSEQLANYKDLKTYMEQYHPGVPIAIGLGMDIYMNSKKPEYAALCNANFNQFVTGNAMKMGSILNNKGELQAESVDAYIAQAKADNPDVEFYGHNLIWHTQQRQDWLKSLIAPKQVVTSDGGGINNLIGNSEFEDNLAGWSGWNNNVRTQVDGGHKGSDKCMEIVVDGSKSTNSWSDQVIYELSEALTPGTTYTYQFWAKALGAGTTIQFFAQQPWSSSGQQQQYGATESLSTEWQLYTGEMTINDGNDQITRPGFQVGGQDATIYLDGVEFGEKVEEAFGGYATDGSFETQETYGDEACWTKNEGSGQGAVEIISMDGAIDGSKVLKVEANSSSANAWDCQLTLSKLPVIKDTKMELSFWIKSDKEGKARCSYSGLSNNYPWMNWTGSQSSWTEAFETSTEWQHIDVVLQNFSTDFSDDATTWSVNFDLGYVADVTYYIDAVEVKEVESSTSKRGLSKAISYELKSAEEKATIIDNAMKTWISTMVGHFKDDVHIWEVINECIDNNGNIRGVNGKGYLDGDSEPVETTEEGLNLNWASSTGNQHFYWGYFLGKDFGVKAFQYAREAAGADAKLYINEYGLEVSDTKLDALIDYVDYIDAQNGSPIVDGICTQMHISCFSTDETKRENAKAGIDNMFTKLAATGKLVRISELDVAFGVSSDAEKDITPTADQLTAQYDTYRYIMESYFKNVPEAQQGGVCIWTLSDNADEHEYWLTHDAPNIFDADYARKLAYKGVCDGIAGKDISTEFSGTEW